jgi:DNA polymerase-3 subunit epsilon
VVHVSEHPAVYDLGVAAVASSRWARWVGLAGRRARRDPAGASPEPTTPGTSRVGPDADPCVDLGAPLFDVCFAVLDVETTGGSPATAALTEIAAAKYRGGECLGEFQTLVDPGCSVPPLISLLTGITDDMVHGAPSVSSVLPSLLEFVRDSVIVGHNVSFDVAFLDAALGDSGRAPLGNATIDTLALARRLVRPDVPNCKLRTLATSLRLEHRPSHRALDDVRATADLLHRLIEHATGYGVFVLGDLVDLVRKPDLRTARVSEVG